LSPKRAISPDAARWLTARFGEGARFSEPLALHTSLSVGGPADALVTAQDAAALSDLITGCAMRNLPLAFLGGGTNLLVPDEGFPGVVARLGKGFSGIRIQRTPAGALLDAGAAAPLPRAVARAQEKGWAGMLFAVGIPGTVGGAVAGNAGTREGWVSDAIADFDCVGPGGETRRLGREEVRWSYRSLSPMGGEPGWKVITRARFFLAPGDPEALKEQAGRMLAQRRQSQPLSQKSAGCFFKNPEKGPAAGALIERAGMKGQTLGGAMVSDIHANFIVNRGNASGSDILGLIARVRDRVEKEFGIQLESEVKILGA